MQRMQYNEPNSMYVFQKFSGDDTSGSSFDAVTLNRQSVGPTSFQILAARLPWDSTDDSLNQTIHVQLILVAVILSRMKFGEPILKSFNNSLMPTTESKVFRHITILLSL